MEPFSKDDLEESIKSISSILCKCNKAFTKFKQGTPQYTLLLKRIKALEMSLVLLEKELSNELLNQSEFNS